jgi:hypothetical protein
MAAKIKSKGTVLAQEISAVFTTIPSLIDISISGEKSQTMDTTALDGTQFMTAAPNGNSECATISANGFYDPDDTVITAFHALTASPVATNFKVTYTDTTPYSRTYSGVGFGIDKTISLADAVKCSYEIVTSGAPS